MAGIPQTRTQNTCFE